MAPTPQGGASVTSLTWAAEQPGETAPADEQAPTSSVVTTTTATTDSTEPPSESFDGFNLRVLTGPLASRTAGPLGPTLASIDAEATQQVDRHERAPSQLIEGLEPLGGEPTVAWRSREPDEGSSGVQANQPGSFGAADGSVVDAPGNGGFPMKVTALGRGERAELAALWATLPSFPDAGESFASFEQAEIAMLERAAIDRSSETAEAPNYVKAACGLAFGLMMTSGPLFPDLIARLPRRIPKWIVVLRNRSARGGFSGVRRFSLAKLSGWLRGRVLWP